MMSKEERERELVLVFDAPSAMRTQSSSGLYSVFVLEHSSTHSSHKKCMVQLCGYLSCSNETDDSLQTPF